MTNSANSKSNNNKKVNALKI